MSRVRTFIALDLGKPIRDRLVSLQENFARAGAQVKWVEPENMHLTLLFLGEVDQRDLLPICRTVATAAQERPAFSLTVAGVGAFPNLRRPRILWVGVGQGVQEVCGLHDALETPLLELGCYRREERKYTPHVTLGRTKTEAASPALEGTLRKYQAWEAGETHIAEVLVMGSELTRDGPTYTVLGRGKLARS